MDTVVIVLVSLAGQPQLLSLVVLPLSAADLIAGIASEGKRLLTLLQVAVRRNA